MRWFYIHTGGEACNAFMHCGEGDTIASHEGDAILRLYSYAAHKGAAILWLYS